MRPVNRAIVEELLADETLSYKEIARRASCSDFSVRTIARELSGDPRPMKTPRGERYVDEAEPAEPCELTTTEKVIGWGIVALLIAGFVFALRVGHFDYPPDGPMP
jgi:hypothetical protein